MQNAVTNPIQKDENSVWVLTDADDFGYSDGIASEKYLEQVFSECSDRSSESEELESRIIDWPSEYHLSRKRSQLLKGFNFDRSLRVLEVGCGCGAITTFLGESFDEVVSVEGTYARARLTRQRTRDMENVEVINARFQDLNFREKFDLILCVGVFEYSGVYIDSEDPHATALQQFSDLLEPDGELLIAIENQFGLKYLAGYNEDHTSRPFDGIEGYANAPGAIRTFGYHDLRQQLLNLFESAKFYFPYPDYKIPDLVVSEEFYSRANCGDLVGGTASRDYTSARAPLFDERLAKLEIAKNNMLPVFANSFLVAAAKSGESQLDHDLAVSFSRNRGRKWSVVTRINEHDGVITAVKSRTSGEQAVEEGMLGMALSESRWVDGITIGSQMYLNANNHDLSLAEIMEDCAPWLRFLESQQDSDGLLDGQYLDCIWGNCITTPDGVVFFDREWCWQNSLSTEIIFVRSAHLFLQDIEVVRRPNRHLRDRSPGRLITRMAGELDLVISPDHLEEYSAISSRLNEIVYGLDARRSQRLLKAYLWRSDVVGAVKKSSVEMKRIKRGVAGRASRVLGR